MLFLWTVYWTEWYAIFMNCLLNWVICYFYELSIVLWVLLFLSTYLMSWGICYIYEVFIELRNILSCGLLRWPFLWSIYGIVRMSNSEEVPVLIPEAECCQVCCGYRDQVRHRAVLCRVCLYKRRLRIGSPGTHPQNHSYPVFKLPLQETAYKSLV